MNKTTTAADGFHPRRRFLEVLAATGIASPMFTGALLARTDNREEISLEDIAAAENIAGLSFTPDQRAMLLQTVQRMRSGYESVRKLDMPNSVAPALVFDPTSGLSEVARRGRAVDRAQAMTSTSKATRSSRIGGRRRPRTDREVAFLSIAELGALLRAKQITSVELTRTYLARLKKHDAVLKCVVTLLENRALDQARRADRELAAGHDRGPLHGIPWGVKDIFAVRGAPTTWGAKPFAKQVIDEDATVVRRLDEAGAVLLAKLSVGALAMGDVWFGGTTKNPWNPKQGSSGSSAGSAAAVVAGLCAFAIGTETLGSIVSPAIRCGATGLRPTFGRVSRHGVMALSWTMDKAGPLTRSVADGATVFSVIHGGDGLDAAAVTRPFTWPLGAMPKGMKVGVIRNRRPSDVDRRVLDTLWSLGAELQDVELPRFPRSITMTILEAEAACAFDDITRDGRVDQLTRQNAGAWPNSFRASRFIPAVEYLRACRARTVLMREMDAVVAEVDVLVSPPYAGGVLSVTNLTGHPCVVMPYGFDRRDRPLGTTFIGQLFGDDVLMAVAHAVQTTTVHHRRRPPVS